MKMNGLGNQEWGDSERASERDSERASESLGPKGGGTWCKRMKILEEIGWWELTMKRVGKTFAIYITDKRLILKIYEELL